MDSEKLTTEINEIKSRQDRYEDRFDKALDKMGDLSSKMEVIISKMDRLPEYESRLRIVENNQSEYKPMIDLMKSINGRIWFLMLGGLATMAAIVYSTIG